MTEDRFTDANRFTDAERAHFRRLKFRAWFGRNGTPAASRSGAMRLAVPQTSTPPRLPRRRLSTQDTPWEEFERLRVDLGPRAVLVPDHLLTTGDRAWRRWEGW